MKEEIPKEGMKVECPRDTCRSRAMKKIVVYSDGSNHIDNLSHYHLECLECGLHFLEWACEIEKVKKAYGDIWRQYV